MRVCVSAKSRSDICSEWALKSPAAAVLLSCFSNLSPRAHNTSPALCSSAFLLKENALLMNLNLQKKCCIRRLRLSSKGQKWAIPDIFEGPFHLIISQAPGYCVCLLRAVRDAFVGTLFPLPDILGSRERSGLLLLRRSQPSAFHPSIFQSASTPWPTQTSRYKGPPSKLYSLKGNRLRVRARCLATSS